MISENLLLFFSTSFTHFTLPLFMIFTFYNILLSRGKILNFFTFGQRSSMRLMRQKSLRSSPVDILLLRLEFIIKNNFFIRALLLGAVKGAAEKFKIKFDELFWYILRLRMFFGRHSFRSLTSLFFFCLDPHRRLGFTNKINILSISHRKI